MSTPAFRIIEFQDPVEAAFKQIVTYAAGLDLVKQLTISDHIQRLFEYTVSGGKHLRSCLSLSISTSYSSSQISPCDVIAQAIVALTLEILHASLLISDDIMDQSVTRRGKPCWYKLEDIGLNAVNDAFIVEHVAYLVAEKYSPAKHRDAILELLRKTMWLTSIGQYLDGKYCYNASKALPSSVPAGESKDEALLKKLDATLTTEHYLDICKMKTSYYTVVNPTKLGLLIAGIDCTPEVLQLVEDICISIGILFQAKDDYLDVYGDPRLFQKVGMDVEDGKCTWVVTTLLHHADTLRESDPQTRDRIRSTVANHYGINTPEDAGMIKALYEEFKLKDMWPEYQTAALREIEEKISRLHQMDPHFPCQVLSELAVFCANRKK